MHRVCRFVCLAAFIFLCTAVAKADFSAAAKNLSNSSGPSYYPEIAGMDGSNNVFVIWMEYIDATQQRLCFAKSTDHGVTWSAPQELTVWGQLHSFAGRAYAIYVDEPRIHIVYNWRADDADDWDIWYQRSDDLGETWDYPPTAITANSTNSVCPDVAAQGEHVHVTFQDNWPGNYAIMYKRLTNYGAGIIDLNRRLTYSTTDAYFPAIAVSLSGLSLNIVYEDLSGSRLNIFLKHIYDSGAGAHDTRQLTFSTASDNREPDIVTSAGNGDSQYVYIVYYANWPGNWDIMYKRLDSWGQTGFSTYTARLTYSATDSWSPAVDFDSLSNNIHISYHDSWPGNPDVMYRKLADYGGAGYTGQRVSWGTGYSTLSSVTSSGASAFIVWMDNTSGNYEIYVKYGN